MTDDINTGNQADKNSDKQKETKRAIQRGLVETAKKTNAWVMTNGIDHAMNRLVEEGLRSNASQDDIPCIGLCNWPCETKHAIQRGLVETAKITNAWVMTNGIDHAMNRLVGEGLHTFYNNIPIVILLLGGGFTTLHALSRYLKGGTPVVVVKRAIQRGLAETAKITNAWVMTNGIDHAMNHLVGEGLCSDTSEDDVPCIAFDDGNPIVILLLGGDRTTLRALSHYLADDIPVVVVQV
ncbi:unnamed protein product [Rotaria sordida]|uniref:TRPM SLOG domain-containing protein n=1 Tax=Rotaria sordida TaxID=392033 RepID=A0A814LXX8_9BILA|nr:unnamed protein product [Rotaria sordida]